MKKKFNANLREKKTENLKTFSSEKCKKDRFIAMFWK